MSAAALAHVAAEALLLAVALALPVVAVTSLVSLAVAAFSSATRLSDAALDQLPRLVSVTIALVVLGPWMGREVVAFTTRVFALAAM